MPQVAVAGSVKEVGTGRGADPVGGTRQVTSDDCTVERAIRHRQRAAPAEAPSRCFRMGYISESGEW